MHWHKRKFIHYIDLLCVLLCSFIHYNLRYQSIHLISIYYWWCVDVVFHYSHVHHSLQQILPCRWSRFSLNWIERDRDRKRQGDIDRLIECVASFSDSSLSLHAELHHLTAPVKGYHDSQPVSTLKTKGCNSWMPVLEFFEHAQFQYFSYTPPSWFFLPFVLLFPPFFPHFSIRALNISLLFAHFPKWLCHWIFESKSSNQYLSDPTSHMYCLN